MTPTALRKPTGQPNKNIEDLLTHGEQPFAALPDSTFEALKREIEANKNRLLVPVVISARGRLIDGHHRLMICQALGRKTINETEWVIDNHATDPETEALAAIGYQLNRRQTSSEDNAMVARKLMRRFSWSQAVVAKKLGVTPAAVSKWLSAHPDPDFEVTERIGADGKVYTIDPDAPPKAKSIKAQPKPGHVVRTTSNKHLAEISNPEFAQWLEETADDDDRVELAAIWRAIAAAALQIAERFEASAGDTEDHEGPFEAPTIGLADEDEMREVAVVGDSMKASDFEFTLRTSTTRPWVIVDLDPTPGRRFANKISVEGIPFICGYAYDEASAKLRAVGDLVAAPVVDGKVIVTGKP